MYFSSASPGIGDRRRVFCAAAKPAAVALSAGLIAARAKIILPRRPFNFQHYSQFRYTGGTVRASETTLPLGPSIDPDARRAQGVSTVQTGEELDERACLRPAHSTRRRKKLCDSGAKFAFTVEAEVVG